jgi:hypothetical protein
LKGHPTPENKEGKVKNALYAFRKLPEGFCVLKCDEDFNYKGSYLIAEQRDGIVCSCPARIDCRHIKMIPDFVQKNRVDTTWYLNFDTKKWIKVRG